MGATVLPSSVRPCYSDVFSNDEDTALSKTTKTWHPELRPHFQKKFKQYSLLQFDHFIRTPEQKILRSRPSDDRVIVLCLTQEEVCRTEKNQPLRCSQVRRRRFDSAVEKKADRPKQDEARVDYQTREKRKG